MNARVKELPDMVMDDNSLHLPLPDDYILDEYLPRSSQDKNMKSNGTLLLEFCKQTNMRILNGRTGSDNQLIYLSYTSRSKRCGLCIGR